MSDEELKTLAEAIALEWQAGDYTLLKKVVNGPDPASLLCPLCGIDRAVTACPSHYPTTCPFMGRT